MGFLVFGKATTFGIGIGFLGLGKDIHLNTLGLCKDMSILDHFGLVKRSSNCF